MSSFKVKALISLAALLLCAVLLAVGFRMTMSYRAGNVELVRLTPEEHAFLKKHPVIRVSNEMDYRPFDFARDGNPAGYSIDYLNLVAERLGIRLEYVNGYSCDGFSCQLVGGIPDVAASSGDEAMRRD